MEPTSSLNDDVELRLPREFLTDDDFLVEKENELFKSDESSLFPYELIHGFGFDRTVNQTGDEESFLTGKIAQSSLEHDFSGGFRGDHAFPADNNNEAWGETRSPPCGRRNQNSHTRVSSQAAAAAAWELYCAAVEEMRMMNLNGYNDFSGRGIPRKHPLASTSNDCAGYYSCQSLQYHRKLQALQFQQQQQLMQRSRGLKANTNKIATRSPSLRSNHQPQRSDDGSGMRAVFLGDRTGKRKSTGTGVFLPRRANHTSSPETREKPSITTVLVPARVAEVLNLDESVVQPSVRSSASSLSGITEPSWRQKSYNGRFSSQMKMEQTVIDPRLPSDWAY